MPTPETSNSLTPSPEAFARFAAGLERIARAHLVKRGCDAPTGPSADAWGDGRRVLRHRTDLVLRDLDAELARARDRFGNAAMLPALLEEVGELARAMVDGSPRMNVRAEAIQVATVALRIATEGDGDFPHTVPPAG